MASTGTGYVNKDGDEVPATVTDAVLMQSESLEDRPEHPPVRGVDWNNGTPTLDDMMAAFMTTGFQATEVRDSPPHLLTVGAAAQSLAPPATTAMTNVTAAATVAVCVTANSRYEPGRPRH